MGLWGQADRNTSMSKAFFSGYTSAISSMPLEVQEYNVNFHSHTERLNKSSHWYLTNSCLYLLHVTVILWRTELSGLSWLEIHSCNHIRNKFDKKYAVNLFLKCLGAFYISFWAEGMRKYHFCQQFQIKALVLGNVINLQWTRTM